MGLTERSARYAAARPRPLVAAVPGGTRERLIVEREIRRRGWFPADAPAAADLLVVCGEPGDGLAEAVEVVWAGMPGPRAVVRLPWRVPEPVVRDALDRAVSELRDDAVRREDATAPGHEHHMMGAPAEVAMADRAPDRDGLKLDVLHVPLGPVLPDWPAGLKVMLTLQGDVVQAAEVEVLAGGGGGRFWDEPWLAAAAGERVAGGEAERRRAASHLDGLARFLGVAGWRAEADRARVLRDAVLAGRPASEIGRRFERFARRTGRSRPLRWMTRGLGRVDPAAIERYGLAGPAARRPGDVADRFEGLLAAVRASLPLLDDPAPLDGDDGPRGPVGRRPSGASLAVLPALLEGVDVASARLIVGSLDPDVDQLAEAAEALDG